MLAGVKGDRTLLTQHNVGVNQTQETTTMITTNCHRYIHCKACQVLCALPSCLLKFHLSSHCLLIFTIHHSCFKQNTANVGPALAPLFTLFHPINDMECTNGMAVVAVLQQLFGGSCWFLQVSV
jgi:hypothetical protein